MSEVQKDAAVARMQMIYANTIKGFMQQVAAQQARIAELREALEDWRLGILGADKLQTLFANKDDLSALEAAKAQARRDALLEAADRCHVEHRRDDLTGDYRFGAGMCEHYIRRMAGEVKS